MLDDDYARIVLLPLLLLEGRWADVRRQVAGLRAAGYTRICGDRCPSSRPLARHRGRWTWPGHRPGVAPGRARQ